MYLVFMFLFIVFLIIQLFNLFRALKNKDNNDWTKFFGVIVGSILSCILIILYVNFFSSSPEVDGIIVILFSAFAFLVYGFILVISFLLKLFQVYKLKKKGVLKKKIDKKLKIKQLIFIVFSILAISSCMCFLDYLVYEYMDKVECERYDTVKEKKLVDMVDYINNKYNVNYTIKDNVFYREYKYSDVEISKKKHNDFYVGIFDNGEEVITVSLNKQGFLSDNSQIDEIGYLLGDYYSNVLGNDIEYVEFRHKGGFCKDDLINEVLQFEFNEIITQDNISIFVDKLLKNDVEIIFYIKDNKNKDMLLKNIIDKLSFLEDKSNVKGLSIYFYDSKDELIIEEKSILVRGDYKYDEIHLSYYSSHMFGFVYVSNNIEFSEEFIKKNDFSTIAFSNKKYANADKYKNKEISVINDWTIYNFK